MKENLSKVLEEAWTDLEFQLQDIQAKRDKVIEEKDIKHKNILKESVRFEHDEWKYHQRR